MGHGKEERGPEIRPKNEIFLFSQVHLRLGLREAAGALLRTARARLGRARRSAVGWAWRRAHVCWLLAEAETLEGGLAEGWVQHAPCYGRLAR